MVESCHIRNTRTSRKIPELPLLLSSGCLGGRSYSQQAAWEPCTRDCIPKTACEARTRAPRLTNCYTRACLCLTHTSRIYTPAYVAHSCESSVFAHIVTYCSVHRGKVSTCLVSNDPGLSDQYALRRARILRRDLSTEVGGLFVGKKRNYV